MRRLNVPIGERLAGHASSYDPDARTVELVIATEAKVRMPGWLLGISDEFFYEVLDCSPDAVDLSEVRAGNCPLLDAHNRWSVKDQLGKVAEGRCERQRVVIKVALGQSEGAKVVEAEIAAGTPPKASAGYRREHIIFEGFEGEIPVYRVTKWTLQEASFVPIAADSNAGVRTAGQTIFPCAIEHPFTLRTLNPETLMPAETTTADPGSSARSEPGANLRPASIQHLREVVGYLSDFGCTDAQRAELVLDMAERQLPVSEANATVLKIAAERQRQQTGPAGVGGSEYVNRSMGAGGSSVVTRLMGGDQTFDNPAFQSRAIEDAIFARMSGRAPSEQAREFMGMSMVQIAGDLLARNGVNVRGLSANDILDAAAWNGDGARSGFLATRAAHTTSDFPDLLLAAGQRYLLDVFVAAGSALKVLSRERSAQDFREISGLQLSAFGTLPKVLEDGELKHGSFTSRKETYRLESFGQRFALSRQAIINDDLGAFGDPMRIMARSAAETEATLLADLINSNPVMADGKPLFHADHGNLAGSAAVPGLSSLSTGRLAMRKQKDLDGVTPISAAPKYIVTSALLETPVEQLLVETTVPTTAEDTNPFRGKLIPLVDPRLADLPWYLFADPALAPVLEHAYLDGQPGPKVEMKDTWSSLGQEYRVYMDFGAGAIDHRGAFKNPGAAPS